MGEADGAGDFALADAGGEGLEDELVAAGEGGPGPGAGPLELLALPGRETARAALAGGSCVELCGAHAAGRGGEPAFSHFA